MKRRTRRAWLILLALLLLGSAYLYSQNNWVQTTRYSIVSAKIPTEFDGYRIVHLSDLHSRQFGPGQSKLAERIRALEPDAIMVTGDMVNATDRQGDAFTQLVSRIRDIPIYYISGNHEQIAASKARNIGLSWYGDYMDELRSLGVTIVDDEAVSIQRGEQSLQLAGLLLPMRLYKRHDTATYVGEKPYEAANITKSVGTASDSSYQILLVHNPMYAYVYADWGADLVLAGHVHGGIIRIPFLGGLLSPERDFFPKYDAGQFHIGGKGDGAMLVSRGLGSSSGFAWRINNRPEIAAITLHAE